MTAVRIAWVMFTVTFSIVGGVFGYALGAWYITLPRIQSLGLSDKVKVSSVAGLTIVGVLFGFVIASLAYRKVVQLASDLERISPSDKVAGVLGITLGLVLAYLITYPFSSVPYPYFGISLKFLAAIICSYLCMTLTISMKDELVQVFLPRQSEDLEDPTAQDIHRPRCKLLDTNVIIDGRMADICKTGFIEGPILIPAFVLSELQLIADSADSMRRARGRRGLDVLNKMQKDLKLMVRVYDDYGPEIERVDTVDAKLVKLAKELDAVIITNDYNLNKVAELHGVDVLNVNELANALKPVVLPGEELSVTIVKEGKEPNQGLAYLEDGTMVVVENASRCIGEVVQAMVTSVLQTVAGKMIFADYQQTTQPAAPHPQHPAGGDLFAEDHSHRASGRARRKGRGRQK